MSRMSTFLTEFPHILGSGACELYHTAEFKIASFVFHFHDVNLVLIAAIIILIADKRIDSQVQFVTLIGASQDFSLLISAMSSSHYKIMSIVYLKLLCNVQD